MNLLLQKIRAVPIILLSNAEWTAISDIVSRLKTEKNNAIAKALVREKIDYPPAIIMDYLNEIGWHKAASWVIPDQAKISPATKTKLDTILAACYETYTIELQATLQDELKFGVEKTLTILSYLAFWDEAADALLYTHQYFNKIWFEVCKDKEMGQDELLPLITEILPDDLALLKKVQQQLLSISNLSTNGRTEYIVLCLQGAIIDKIESFQVLKIPVEERILRRVKNAVQAMRLHDMHDKLIYFTRGYIKDLLEHFFSVLKVKENTVYNLHVQSEKQPEEIVEDIIAESQDGTKSFTIQDSELNTLLNKYHALKDIFLVLTNEHSLNHKLYEFTKKYENYRELLKSPFHEGFLKAAAWSIYHLFHEQTFKDRFLSLSEKVCKEDSLIDPAYLEEVKVLGGGRSP